MSKYLVKIAGSKRSFLCDDATKARMVAERNVGDATIKILTESQGAFADNLAVQHRNKA
jgi:hypothetical protein